MLSRDVANLCPPHWFPMHPGSPFEIFQLQQGTREYIEVQGKLVGTYYSAVQGIFKVQNPVTYAKFALKTKEYGQRGDGNYRVKQFFHDTSTMNVDSIALHNFQVFFAERCRFGSGVYFSSSPYAANRCSNKMNGARRAMFVVDVLVQNVQILDDFECCVLPDPGYDTVVGGTNGSTYVKYFDSEFYPSYFLSYISKF